jgi:hypothetical protein
MTEDISKQLLSQASENIQKLFDLTTRVDERLKSAHNKQEQLEKRIEDQIEKNIELMNKIVILENNMTLPSQINDIDKRLSRIENEHGIHSERYKTIANFIIQLVWVILAAYVLTKLNLQSPSVP